jgi:hypothetical protein
MAILPDDPKNGKEKERALGSNVMDGVAEKLLRQRITDAVVGRLKSILHDPVAITAAASDFKVGHEESRKFIDLLNRYVFPAPAAGLISLYLIRALRRGIDAAAWSRMTRSTTFGAGRHQQQQRDRANNATSKFPQSPFRQKDRSNNNNGLLMEKRQPNTRIVGEETGPPPSSFLGWYNTFTWVLDSLFSLQLAHWTFLYFTNERDAAFAKIPLVSGESAIARELCPLLFDQFRDVKKAGHRRRPTTSTGSTSDQSFDNAKLQSFWTMHENCRLRANYQRQLQRESGSSVVPPPGVPTIGPHTALDFDEQSDKKHPDEGRSSLTDEEESDDKDS